MTIERITEYQNGYVLTLRLEEDALYSWQITRSDGVWMKEHERAADWLTFESALEAGRAALSRHAWLEDFYERARQKNAAYVAGERGA